MNVLVIGATGYIGTAVSEALKDAGHTVAGTARSEEAAQKLRTARVEPITADVTRPDSLRVPVQRADAVIYAVQYHGSNVFEVESAALQTISATLAATNKSFVYTSGVWIYGNTGDRAADEQSPIDPAVTPHRPKLEHVVLESAKHGVCAIVLRPGDVYGRAAGIPAMWVQSAKEEGAARIVGEGYNHWPVVHIEDLAPLYVQALEKGTPGNIYNAADETWLTVREMAEAASYGAGKDGAIKVWPLEEARKALGQFADALALDSRVNSQKARAELGWHTRSSTIIDDLRSGSYAPIANILR